MIFFCACKTFLKVMAIYESTKTNITIKVDIFNNNKNNNY